MRPQPTAFWSVSAFPRTIFGRIGLYRGIGIWYLGFRYQPVRPCTMVGIVGVDAVSSFHFYGRLDGEGDGGEKAEEECPLHEEWSTAA
jgi:hypothetical protein